MKIVSLIVATAFVTFSCSAALAEPSATQAPMSMPAAPTDHAAHHGAQMHALATAAQNARTPAERNRLMAENMTMMKAQMAEMAAMMEPATMPMAMPMTMDAAHMEKMGRHMAMMHQMMESLMVQQQLMMRSGR